VPTSAEPIPYSEIGVGESIEELPTASAPDFLSRARSTRRAMKPAIKYKTMIGNARRSIVNGSAVGVNAAEKTKIPNTQILHGLKIVAPRKKPIRLNVRRNTGSSNAKPKSKIIRRTKSR
jgi:hypothetical protein